MCQNNITDQRCITAEHWDPTCLENRMQKKQKKFVIPEDNGVGCRLFNRPDTLDSKNICRTPNISNDGKTKKQEDCYSHFEQQLPENQQDTADDSVEWYHC